MKGGMWRTEESVVLQSMRSQRVRHSLETEQEQQSMGQEEVPHLWHTGTVGRWILTTSRESEWRSQGSCRPRCGLGSQDPEGTSAWSALRGAPPKVPPLPEQMELVRGTLRAADQGHVLTWPQHGAPLGWERGFLGQTWKEERQFPETGSSRIPCPSALNWEFTPAVPLNSLSLLLSLSYSPLSLSYFLSLGLWNCLPPNFFPSCIFLNSPYFSLDWLIWSVFFHSEPLILYLISIFQHYSSVL